jgi:hypothetical protein
MSKKIIVVTFIILGFCIIFITGCYKVTTYTVPTDVAVTTPVSLATDLIPIFSKNCSISGCHNSGGLKPDLSSDKVYNSLINGNYVDIGTPENSQVYQWLTGKKAVAMPVGAANNPSNINQLVLAWIKQGAKNN